MKILTEHKNADGAVYRKQMDVVGRISMCFTQISIIHEYEPNNSMLEAFWINELQRFIAIQNECLAGKKQPFYRLW